MTALLPCICVILFLSSEHDQLRDILDTEGRSSRQTALIFIVSSFRQKLHSFGRRHHLLQVQRWGRINSKEEVIIDVVLYVLPKNVTSIAPSLVS